MALEGADVKSRLQAIGEARVAIQKWLADPKEEERGLKSPLQAEARSTSKVAWVAAAGLGVIVAGLSLVHFREKAPDALLMRFEIPAPEKVALGDSLSVDPGAAPRRRECSPRLRSCGADAAASA